MSSSGRRGDLVTGIDHVQVAAPPGCERAARAFYADLLGMAELEKPAALQARGGAWFRSGGCELHVGVEEPFTAARKAHPGLRVASGDALHALADRLHAAGYPVTWADDVPGRLRIHTADPFGNRLELLV